MGPQIFKLDSTETALAFLLPPHHQSEINSLRKIHDKAYTKWQPHINIIFPFVSPSLLPSALSILRETLQFNDEIGPVDLNTNEVGTFKHRRNATVILKPSVEVEEVVCRLRKLLVGALGCAEGEGTREGVFRPHLSIGQAGFQGDTLERLVEQAGKLRNVSWKGGSLVVLKRQASGEMVVVDELKIGDVDEEGVEGQASTSETNWQPCYQLDSDRIWRSTLPLTNTTRSDTKDIQIITYNIMAEPLAPSFTSRLPLLIEAIKTATPSSTLQILNLQEVNEESLPLILSSLYIQNHFPFSTHSPSTLLPSHRNLVTLASHPFGYLALDFPERHKSSLIVSLDAFNIEVANVHLTSGLNDQAVQAKLNQMQILSDFVTRKEGTKIVCFVAGDFNLTSSSRTIESAGAKNMIKPETARQLENVINSNIWDDIFDFSSAVFTDHQNAEFEGEEGATFDRLGNPLAALTDSPIENRPERYDRVLVGKGRDVEVKQFETIGLPNRRGECGSDHYGLSVVLRILQMENTPTLLQGEFSTGKFVGIELTEDTTDISSLLSPYLPTPSDREQRLQAISLLSNTLQSTDQTANLILAPLGSYCMDTYFPDSDVDLLAIGSIASTSFFDLAFSLLKPLNSGSFKGVHFVNSLVSIIEVSVLGIKFDLQYCEAPKFLDQYHSISTPNLEVLIFDKPLISSLSPSSLRPLNTYRDTIYLLSTLPHLETYRTTYRFLALHLKSKGLYSAKFSYLGGIHLSLMLSHLLKSLHSSQTTETPISPASLIRTFFHYYSTFPYATKSITDPSLAQHHNIERAPRDAIFIPSIHVPTARKNVAQSCTILSASLLTYEFTLACQRLEKWEWTACLKNGVEEFLDKYGAFVKVEVDMWDLAEIEGGGTRIREVIGKLEGWFPKLMVSLGKIGGLEGQVWPARFCREEQGGEEIGRANELKGCYLVGVSVGEKTKKLDDQQKRVFEGKVSAVIREFENTLQESRELKGGNVWVAVGLVSRSKVNQMRLVVDRKDWGSSVIPINQQGSGNEQVLFDPANEDKKATTKKPSSQQKQKKTSLRPAQNIISRIHWDAKLEVEDFLIGYEDRFLGVKEIEMRKWKSEQTDEEFIPMHRIVWVRRRNDGQVVGEKVWDRKEKVDLIFGSGIGRVA